MADEATLPVFSVCPNDGDGALMERLIFRTDVLDAQDASEQLRGTRYTPRRLFEYEMFLEDDVRRFMASRAFGNGGGRWQLPVWVDGVALGSSLSSGSTAVAIDTSDREFVPGFAVIVGDDATESEVLEVTAVDGSGLTVEPTARTWSAGSMVYPAVVARFDGPWTTQAFTTGDAFGTARLVSAQANPFASVAPSTTYRGLPVFSLCPRANEPESGVGRELDTFDDDLGIPAVFDIAGLAIPTQSVTVTAEGREEAAELRSLIYWLDGMRGVLWLPTFQQDLRVTANIGSAATQITVAACNYTLDVAMALNRRDIRIETWGGAVYHRRITACAAPGGGVELLTIDSALGAAVTVADIKRVSFLQLVRSDSDIFELAWWTGDTVDCAFAFKGVRRDV